MADIEFRVCFTNKRALTAIGAIVSTLSEVEEDMPWREDVQRAIRACRYLVRHVGVTTDADNLGWDLETE